MQNEGHKGHARSFRQPAGMACLVRIALVELHDFQGHQDFLSRLSADLTQPLGELDRHERKCI